MNILVGSTCRAIITDFGSARVIDDRDHIPEDESRAGQPSRDHFLEESFPAIHIETTSNLLTLSGPSFTLRWAPPEVVNGSKPGLASDVWSAGWIMTDKVPFDELAAEGLIMLSVIEGKVPVPREDEQLAQVVRLCNLMLECWKFAEKLRPPISWCCKEVHWMPSIPPSDREESKYRVALLQKMGNLYLDRQKYGEARRLYIQALFLAQRKGIRISEANTLVRLGDILLHQNKPVHAEKLYKRAQAIYIEIGNDLGQANVVNELGTVYRAQFKYDQAEESYQLAQDIHTRIGNDLGRANALSGLGDLYRYQGKYEQAEESFKLAQELYAQICHDQGQANMFKRLGDVYQSQCHYAQAEERYKLAQKIYTRIGDDLGRASTLRDCGHVFRQQHRHAEAAMLYRQAGEVFALIGMSDREAHCKHCLNIVTNSSEDSSEPHFVSPPRMDT
ncbi:hypothetical protein FRB90_007621 [Tulasnella sp. 427]|nr:hypothetical protein FRB90_007621 [Tulasnella sp. 427]